VAEDIERGIMIRQDTNRIQRTDPRWVARRVGR